MKLADHCPLCGAWVRIEENGEIEYHTVWARRSAIIEKCLASFRQRADFQGKEER